MRAPAAVAVPLDIGPMPPASRCHIRRRALSDLCAALQ
jgi:hypothetical protein